MAGSYRRLIRNLRHIHEIETMTEKPGVKYANCTYCGCRVISAEIEGGRCKDRPLCIRRKTTKAIMAFNEVFGVKARQTKG